MMLKTTLHSSKPATFNMGLLYENAGANRKHFEQVVNFLKSKNIRDYRIAVKEDIHKGHSFCDIHFDLAKYLFDSINFHQVFDTDNEKEIKQIKIDVFNDIVSHFKLDIVEEHRNATIKSHEEYSTKHTKYFKELLRRAVDIHKSLDSFNTTEEGIQYFWSVVDHCIFSNGVKYELRRLRCMRANAD